MNKKIELYTGPFCNYCVKAKRLLQEKKLNFIEININSVPEKRIEMINRSNGKTTIPQIFINDVHIGGYKELNLLNIKGKLDKITVG